MGAGLSSVLLVLFFVYSVCATNNAAPIPQPPSVPPPGPPPSFSVNASNQFPDGSWACVIGREAWAPDQCLPHCGDERANKTIVCNGLNYPDGPNNGQPITMISDGQSRHLGRCQCDVPLLTEVFYTVAIHLPDIAAIGCDLLFKTFDLVLQAGLDAFPPGRILDVGAQTALTGTREIADKLIDATQVSNTFAAWFDNPCPRSNYTDKIDPIFDGLIAALGGRGIIPGKGRPGGALPGAKGKPSGMPKTGEPPKPSAKPDPSQAPKTSAPHSKASSKSEATSSTQRACGLGKRDAAGTGTWTSCNNKEIHSTIAVSVDFGPKETTITKHCDAKLYPQACYHYQSVQSRSDRWKELTCSDFQGQSTAAWQPRPNPNAAPRRPAAALYGRQHIAGWRDPKYRAYPGGAGTCHADEYPPLYWYNKDSQEIRNNEQLIRYLPGPQNEGAATYWSSFCWNNGLAPDGQPLSDSKIRIKDVKGKPDQKIVKGITHITSSATVSIDIRPVFTFAFDKPLPKDLGLVDNLCQPIAFGLKDLGFVLRTDDPWYADNNMQPQYEYRKRPGEFPGVLDYADKHVPPKNFNVQRDLGILELNDTSNRFNRFNRTFAA